jgi:hypothetical protein
METCSPVEEQPVHFACGRVGIDRSSQTDQLIGGFTHCGNNGHHLMTLLLAGDKPFRNVANTLRRSHRSPAEFTYD